MFCQSANQSLKGVEVPGIAVGGGMQNNIGYSQLFKRLAEAGIFQEEPSISSWKEVGPLLLKLLEKFKKSPECVDKKKQAVFVWSFREYLGRDIAF